MLRDVLLTPCLEAPNSMLPCAMPTTPTENASSVLPTPTGKTECALRLIPTARPSTTTTVGALPAMLVTACRAVTVFLFPLLPTLALQAIFCAQSGTETSVPNAQSMPGLTMVSALKSILSARPSIRQMELA